MPEESICAPNSSSSPPTDEPIYDVIGLTDQSNSIDFSENIAYT